MKILVITNLYPAYKDQSRLEVTYAVHNFTKKWVDLGHDVTVIRPWPIYNKIFCLFPGIHKKQCFSSNDKFVIDGVKVLRRVIRKFPKIDYSSRVVLKFVSSLLKNLETEYYDYIICHRLEPSLYIAVEINKTYQSKLIAVMHSTDIINLRKYKKKAQRFNSFIGDVSLTGFRSVKLKNDYEELSNNRIVHKLEKSKQFVIESGINSHFILNENELSVKINREIRNFIIISRLIPLKNIDVLIDAFAQLDNEKYSLKIIGNGPLLKNLQKRIKSKSTKCDIKLLGEVSPNRVKKLLYDSDVFIMVSSPETFGLVYLEALATGCITVGSENEGIDGILVNEKNGFLVKPRNRDDLLKVIIKILSIDNYYKISLIMNGIETAKGFLEENVAKDYLKKLSK